MNINNRKSPIIRCAALFLLSGAALSAVGCNLNNNESLFFTIKGKDLEVTFCDRGAAIYSIKYLDTFVTYHPKDINTFLKDDYYYGKALGRIAGRIPDGKLVVEGKEYQLDINEKDNYYKNNNIHGGKDSITTKNFRRYVSATPEYTKVEFTYFSPSMESGFPEDLDCRYTYKVYHNESKIDLDILGIPSGVTPLNLSNHPYFRLSNTGDILDHYLYMPNVTSLAKFKMHDDNRTDQVVIGEIPIETKGYEPWDFTNTTFKNGKKIGQDIKEAKSLDLTSGGYDHIWKYSGNNCAVQLINNVNGFILNVDSDADAVIMYANCYPHLDDEMNPEGKDALYAGITVEPVKFYTKDTVDVLNCSPDNPFKRHTSYSFDTLWDPSK